MFMVIAFLLGRVLFGGFFLLNAYNHFKNRKALTEYARAKKVLYPKVSVIATGVLLLLGGISVLIGYEMIAGMGLLLLFLIPTTFIMHKFWKETDPYTRQTEYINFTKNLALIGAILIIASMAYIFL